MIERFKNLPLRVAQFSRLVSNKDLAEVKGGLKKGTIDIVRRHSCAARQEASSSSAWGCSSEIDEEQHFGVTHKERLKQRFREDVHVLHAVGDADPAHPWQLGADWRARAVADQRRRRSTAWGGVSTSQRFDLGEPCRRAET